MSHPNPFRPGDHIDSHGWTIEVVGPDWIVYRRIDGSVGSTSNLTGLVARPREDKPEEPARFVLNLVIDRAELAHTQAVMSAIRWLNLAGLRVS